MSKYLLSIVMIFSLFVANAQTTMLGKVVDATSRNDVGYATVALLRDTTIVAAVAAGVRGLGFELMWNR